MKKILFSMLCLMMAGIQSVKAQVAIAALHHNDSVTIYSASGIQSAIDKSVAGDTIYLSEGIFGGFTVDKPIVIIGAGQTTMISSTIYLGKDSSTSNIETGLLLSGLNIIQDVSFRGAIVGARIMQCKIDGTCSFSTASYASFDNIEIIMSQMNGLSPGSKVKGLSVVSSKITKVSSDGADEGSVTILNCNINDAGTGVSQNNNYVNCIINQLASGVFTNCLYNSTYSSAVVSNCYQNPDLTLDDDLNCSLTDEQLKDAGYLGTDNTVVGITGGEVQFSLVMPVVQVTEHNVEIDQTERKLKVSLKLGNK